MQRGPNAVAAFTPSHFGAGCGAFQRSAPTGGAAYGMPLNTRTSEFVPAAPDTNPASVLTGSEIAADAIDAAANIPTMFTAQHMRFMSESLLNYFFFVTSCLRGTSRDGRYFPAAASAAARSSARAALSMFLMP
jgi:hypothetical protein